MNNISRCRILIGTIAALGLTVASGPATAGFSLGGYSGPIEVDVNGFDSGTIGYPVMPSAGDVVCGNAQACDAVPGLIPSPGSLVLGSPISAREDTWGVINIPVIADPVLGNVWTNSGPSTTGHSPNYLTGMFYGFADDLVTYDGNFKWEALSLGGFLDIYYRETGTTPDPLAGTSGRTSLNTYSTTGGNNTAFTYGELILRLQFTPGVVLGDLTHTFRSTFTALATSGSSAGFMDVIGGTYDYIFDTNGLMDPNGNYHDMGFDMTFNTQNTRADWLVRIQGQTDGAVPEPGTLALVALGVLGAARARRRATPVAPPVV